MNGRDQGRSLSLRHAKRDIAEPVAAAAPDFVAAPANPLGCEKLNKILAPKTAD
jgi:hypothetical protein